jgi:hypothetical protein
LVFVAACGARSGTPTPTPRTGSATQPRTTPPPNPRGPTEAECDALLSHVMALAVVERKQPPSEADMAALRDELRAVFLPDCRAGTRAYHQCGLVAKKRADLEACR